MIDKEIFLGNEKPYVHINLFLLSVWDRDPLSQLTWNSALLLWPAADRGIRNGTCWIYIFKARCFHLDHSCTYSSMIYHPTHQNILQQVLQKAKSTLFHIFSLKDSQSIREEKVLQNLIKVNRIIHIFMRQMFSSKFYYRY